MRSIKNLLALFILSALLINCSGNQEQMAISNALQTAIPGLHNQEEKTLLVISSVDCNRCFYNELIAFLQNNSCHAALLIGNNPEEKLNLDDNVMEVLNEHNVSLFVENTQDLIINIAKYSGIKQSPYIVKYTNERLDITGLKGG